MIASMRNVLNSINMLGFISAQTKKLSNSDYQAKRRDWEMNNNKGNKKVGGTFLTFVTWKRIASIFF